MYATLPVALLLTLVGQPAETAPKASATAPFLQDVARSYTTTDGLPSDDGLAVLAWQGSVLVGTSGGAVHRTDEGFEAIDGLPEGAALPLCVQDTTALIAAGSALWSWDGRPARQLAPLPNGSIRIGDTDRGPAGGGLAATADGPRIWLLTADELFLWRDGKWTTVALPNIAGVEELELRDVEVVGEVVWLAAREGLFRAAGGRGWEEVRATTAGLDFQPVDVRALIADRLRGESALWFAAANGVARLRDAWSAWPVDGKLPSGDFTSASTTNSGQVWLGTTVGAVRFDGETVEYRQGLRWLPDDDVRSIAVDTQGTTWFATASGVGAIARQPITLAEKARRYESEIERRHRRTPLGYVLGLQLKNPGDPESGRQPDSDNDGLWTSMYGAGECLAWAATRDPEAKRRAQRAFEALRFLGTVTQGGSHPAPPGFVARTILTTSGPDPNEGRIERDRAMRRTRDRQWKIIEPRWPVSADGKWYWKCDTSSDELDGHYFFYGLYHDLVATTDAEKASVRDVVTALTDHLIDNDFNLVDHDGLPTRWGHFGPADLNHNPVWWEERGLNSLSMLAYLAVAEHVTGGGEKYRQAARHLIDEHAYLTNVHVPKNQTGPGTGNQSDDEMAFMGYYNLLRYEKKPERRRIYAWSLYRYWQLEKPERNPLFCFIAASLLAGEEWADPWGTTDLTVQADALRDSVDTLRRFPLDRFDWGHRNSQRRDIVRLPGEPGRGHLAGGRVLPIDERWVNHWNHDPWRLDTGGSGRFLADGASFLLPYYLGLYHGFIGKGR